MNLRILVRFAIPIGAAALCACANESMHGNSKYDAKKMGGLDKSVIDETIRQQMPKLRACYERELSSNPELAGRVRVLFTIDHTGHVMRAEVIENTINEPKVPDCVLQVVKEYEFPEPNGGGTVEVNYPFAFSPKKRAAK